MVALAPDASLFIPYEVAHRLDGGNRWYVLQPDPETPSGVLFLSTIGWASQAEAEQHCADLEYLRLKAVEALPKQQLWVSIDIAADGPDAVVIVEKTLSATGVLGWRLLNPAADDDNALWVLARETTRRIFDTLAMEELPLDETESLWEHLATRHRHDVSGLTDEDVPHWIERHRYKLHRHRRTVDHTHEFLDDPEPDEHDVEVDETPGEMLVINDPDDPNFFVLVPEDY